MKTTVNIGNMKVECDYLEKCSDASDKRCRTCMNNKIVYEAKAAELKKESFFTAIFVPKQKMEEQQNRGVYQNPTNC